MEMMRAQKGHRRTETLPPKAKEERTAARLKWAGKGTERQSLQIMEGLTKQIKRKERLSDELNCGLVKK